MRLPCRSSPAIGETAPALRSLHFGIHVCPAYFYGLISCVSHKEILSEVHLTAFYAGIWRMMRR